jgi:hypothetical protein
VVDGGVAIATAAECVGRKGVGGTGFVDDDYGGDSYYVGLREGIHTIYRGRVNN